MWNSVRTSAIPWHVSVGPRLKFHLKDIDITGDALESLWISNTEISNIILEKKQQKKKSLPLPKFIIIL